MLGVGKLLGRGEGDIVVDSLGHNGGCKGKSEGGGGCREEECGGQRVKRKKTKRRWEG